MKTLFILATLISLHTTSAPALANGAVYTQSLDGDEANPFITAIEAAGAKAIVDAKGETQIDIVDLTCPTVYEMRKIAGTPGCTFSQLGVLIHPVIESSVNIDNSLGLGHIHATVTSPSGAFSHFVFNTVHCSQDAAKSSNSACDFTFQPKN